MRKRFFPRFFALALCLVFSLTLSAPAFAAGAYPTGYIFVGSLTFYENDFTSEGENYSCKFDMTGIKASVDSEICAVSFSNQTVYTNCYEYLGTDDDLYSKAYCVGNPALVGVDDKDNGHPFVICLYYADKSNSLFVCNSDFYNQYFLGTGETGVQFDLSVPDPDFEPGSFLEVFFDLFGDVGNWLLSQLNLVVNLFWTVNADGIGSFTFLGVISLVALGVSLSLLLIKVVLNFLHLRG